MTGLWHFRLAKCWRFESWCLFINTLTLY